MCNLFIRLLTITLICVIMYTCVYGCDIHGGLSNYDIHLLVTSHVGSIVFDPSMISHIHSWENNNHSCAPRTVVSRKIHHWLVPLEVACRISLGIATFLELLGFDRTCWILLGTINYSQLKFNQFWPYNFTLNFYCTHSSNSFCCSFLFLTRSFTCCLF